MSKAILIMDMPNNCEECPLRQYKIDGIPEESCIAQNNKELINLDIKPNWCPLKEVPQKKEVSFNHWDRAVFANGYNACIDEILKEV